MKKTFILALIALVACSIKKESISFDTISYDEKVLLFPERKDTVPSVDLHYIFTYPKTFIDAEKVQELQSIFQERFWGEGYGNYNTPKEAEEAYVKNYIQTYRDDMREEYCERLKEETEKISDYIYSRTEAINNTIILCNDSLLSFQVYSYSEMYGGAVHPNSSLLLTSINLNTLRVIQVKDIFTEGYEEVLGGMIRSKLLQIMEDNGGKISDFFNFNKISSNNNFYLTQTGIEFTYNSNEIAPYVAGRFDIEFTYQELKKILKPDLIQSYFEDITFENIAEII